MSKERRRNEIADQIVQAFAQLPAIQDLIPSGHALHVKAVWDPQDQSTNDDLLPYGLLLEVKPPRRRAWRRRSTTWRVTKLPNE